MGEMYKNDNGIKNEDGIKIELYECVYSQSLPF